MRVLVACEFSGRVRDAFARRGHEAYSCDLLPTEVPGPHIEGDVSTVLRRQWDLIIAHPPCTYLTCAANGHHKKNFAMREPLRQEAARFFMECYNANTTKIAVENPIGKMSTLFRKPNFIIQPWQFGHPERKATCFWTRGLPPLSPTNIVTPETAAGISPKGKKYYSLNWLPRTPDRWKIRSRTFQGIADAMAEQWGSL